MLIPLEYFQWLQLHSFHFLFLPVNLKIIQQIIKLNLTFRIAICIKKLNISVEPTEFTLKCRVTTKPEIQENKKSAEIDIILICIIDSKTSVEAEKHANFYERV